MLELPDYLSRAAEDVSRAVRLEMEDGDLVGAVKPPSKLCTLKKN